MRKLCALVLFVLPLPAQDLFQAIRNDDLSTLRKAIDTKADLSVKDRRGATLLMQAGAFGSLEAMRMLIDAGADVNARNAFDATALLWSAGDAEKVRLLVDKGANVNTASKMGQTPLIAAAAHQGNIASVRLLLDKGADVKAADPRGITPLLHASMSGDLAIVQLLLARGADAKQISAGGGTALGFAAGNLDLPMTKLLLVKGTDVNAANAFGGEVKNGKIKLTNLTPLIVAAPFGSPELLRTLLDAGAKVNAVDGRGMTPLALAVATERQNPASIRLLLKNGADVNARNDMGQTPLDWAMIYCNPKVIDILRAAGGKPGDPHTPPTRPSQEVVEAPVAVARAVQLMQRVNSTFFQSSGCAACHHQNLAQVLVAEASSAGVPIDRGASVQMAKEVHTGFQQMQEILLQGMDPPTVDIPLYGLLGMAVSGHTPDVATDSVAAYILARQGPDGGWSRYAITRPPIEESNIQRAAMGLRVLQAFRFPGRKSEFETAIAKARGYLERAKPVTNDDHVWLAVGLHWAEPSHPRSLHAAKQLLKQQHSDGGWAQNQWSASDAYATGEALWALRALGVLKVTDPAFQKGANHLLRTQFPDGSWYVRSRAPKFQPYFQSGFPFDHDQWVSSSATAWAAAALAPLAAQKTVAVK